MKEIPLLRGKLLTQKNFININHEDLIDDLFLKNNTF